MGHIYKKPLKEAWHASPTPYDQHFVLQDYIVRIVSLVLIGFIFIEAMRRRLRRSE
jgi:hypothetical protein